MYNINATYGFFLINFISLYCSYLPFLKMTYYIIICNWIFNNIKFNSVGFSIVTFLLYLLSPSVFNYNFFGGFLLYPSILYNYLLSNAVVYLHPALLQLLILLVHSCLILVTLVLSLQSFDKFTLCLFKNNLHSSNLYALIFVTLLLGSFWAQQLSTWGGWWNWDPSEFILLIILYLIILINHIGTRKLYVNYILFRIWAISLGYLILYYFNQLFLDWNFHVFFSTDTELNLTQTLVVFLYLIITIRLISSFIFKYNSVRKLNMLSADWNSDVLYMCCIFAFIFNLYFVFISTYALCNLNEFKWIFFTTIFLIFSIYNQLFNLVNLTVIFNSLLSWTLTTHFFLLIVILTLIVSNPGLFMYNIACQFFIEEVWCIYWSVDLIMDKWLYMLPFNLFFTTHLFFYNNNWIDFLNLIPYEINILLFLDNSIFLLFYILVVYNMRFYSYYSWLRYLLLTPSYNFKNRLFIEKFNQTSKIHSFFGETYKSFSWHTFSSANLSNFWSTVSFFRITLMSIIVLYVLLLVYSLMFTGSNLTFIYVFKVLYYIIWRVLDYIYFFTLQIQYLFITYSIILLFNCLNTITSLQFNPIAWLNKQFAEHPFITGNTFVSKFDKDLEVNNYLLKSLISANSVKLKYSNNSSSTLLWPDNNQAHYLNLILNYYRLNFLFSLSDFIYATEINHFSSSNWLTYGLPFNLLNVSTSTTAHPRNFLAKLLPNWFLITITPQNLNPHTLNNFIYGVESATIERSNLVKLTRWVLKSPLLTTVDIRAALSLPNLLNNLNCRTNNHLITHDHTSKFLISASANYLMFRQSWYSSLNFYYKEFMPRQLNSTITLTSLNPTVNKTVSLVLCKDLCVSSLSDTLFLNKMLTYTFVKPLNYVRKVSSLNSRYDLTLIYLTEVYTAKPLHFIFNAGLFKTSLVKLH